jgi:hypothetical protein
VPDCSTGRQFHGHPQPEEVDPTPLRHPIRIPDAEDSLVKNAEPGQHAIHDHYDSAGILTNADCNGSTYIFVNDEVMQRLHASGMAMPIPSNGPADGPPLYPVACNLYRTYTQCLCQGDEMRDPRTSVIDPTLLTPTLSPMRRSNAMPMPSLMPTPSPMPMPSPTPTPMKLRPRKPRAEQANHSSQRTKVANVRVTRRR